MAGATALTSYDFEVDLPSIRVPVLLVAGSQDGAMPAIMQALQKRIAGSLFKEIPDAGDLLNLEQPDAFNATAGLFLSS